MWQGVDPPYVLTLESAMVPNLAPASPGGNGKDSPKPGQAPPLITAARTDSPGTSENFPPMEQLDEETAPSDGNKAADQQADEDTSSAVTNLVQEGNGQGSLNTDVHNTRQDDSSKSKSESKETDDSGPKQQSSSALQILPKAAPDEYDTFSRSSDKILSLNQALQPTAGADLLSKVAVSEGAGPDKRPDTSIEKAQAPEATNHPLGKDSQLEEHKDIPVFSNLEDLSTIELHLHPLDILGSDAKDQADAYEPAPKAIPSSPNQDNLLPSIENLLDSRILNPKATSEQNFQ